jgi:GAF domain-containing protein
MRRRNTDSGPTKRQVHANKRKVRRARAAPTLTTDLHKQLNQRTRERDEALEQQAATAEVLKAISRSTSDVQPVFDAIAENAVRLCKAERAFIFQFDGTLLRAVATYNVGPEIREFVDHNPVAPGRHSISARAALERRTVQVPDVQSDPNYAYAMRDREPIRTILAVPMLKGEELVGTITIYRLEVNPFTDKQVALVETFAAQAVIAIENTRLLSELRESLERQTATSEVLRVISASPSELTSVFENMLANATRICRASFGSMLLRDGDGFRRVAIHNPPPQFADFNKGVPIVNAADSVAVVRVVTTKQIVHMADLLAEDPEGPLAKFAGARTLLSVPLLKDNEVMGVFGVYRQEVRPFTDKQIELVQNFAAQAVIALENARLLNELRQRTSDLSESLEQQTATSEVLRVISSTPGELEPVFQAMLENAVRICGSNFGILNQYRNGAFHLAATVGVPPVVAKALVDRGAYVPPAGKPLDQLLKTRSAWRSEVAPFGANDQRGRDYWCVQYLPHRGAALHRQANRTGAEFCCSSCHRHREHTATKRAARIAATADRDG